ncbi:MAG: TetR/AcrR family transcriptional regulator [Castellaniella sp.]|uniref:TetR/AcrR family transcriptional regulator n=1 Tax=Castellaniella sp. TaxID=1955812 RepID=UPI003C711230
MGRRREFDVDRALDAALTVFWAKGYEGATYTDLTQATGVERPALYSAFGNKESLFRRALERYDERYLSYFPEALKQARARQVVAQILYGAVELHTQCPDHAGCLAINGALAGSGESDPIRRVLIETRAAAEASLRQRFEQARQAGDLPGTADCAVLAGFVMTVLHGMAVQAKAGVGRDMLMAIADQALAMWPAGQQVE